MLLLALGGSDCEALHDGWLGQPVNAVSSLVYVLAGAYVLRRGGPVAPAAALAAVGVGSVLYHGPMPDGAGAVHDGSIVALGAVLAVTGLRGRLGRPRTMTPWVLGGVAIAANLLTRTGAPLCRPDSVLQGHAVWHVLTAAALAAWVSPRGRSGAARTRPRRPARRRGSSSTTPSV